MKLFIAFLIAGTTSAFAVPHVWNNGTSVSFDYWNTSDRDQRCTGPIYLTMEDGSNDTIHVHEFAWARRSIYRTYYPNSVGSRISRLSHAVWCW